MALLEQDERLLLKLGQIYGVGIAVQTGIPVEDTLPTGQHKFLRTEDHGVNEIVGLEGRLIREDHKIHLPAQKSLLQMGGVVFIGVDLHAGVPRIWAGRRAGCKRSAGWRHRS